MKRLLKRYKFYVFYRSSVFGISSQARFIPSEKVNVCCDLTVSLFLQWKTEILDYCPSTRILLIGCKTDLRTDVCTLMELSNQKQVPLSHEQVS